MERLRLLWDQRRLVGRLTLGGLVLGTRLACILPAQYQCTVQLMPPDTQSSSGAMLAALSAKAGGIGAMAGDLLGGNSTGALFIGILRSRTLEDRLVPRFDLKKVYRAEAPGDARTPLTTNNGVCESLTSGSLC